VPLDLLVDHDHGGVVDHLRAQVGERPLVLVGALLTAGAVEGELDCRRVERFAVLEFDAAAQLEGVRLQVGRNLPAFGQHRRHAAVGVDLGQRFEHVVLNDLGNGCGGAYGRIEPRRFERHADHNRILAALRQGKRWQGRGQCGRGR